MGLCCLLSRLRALTGTQTRLGNGDILRADGGEGDFDFDVQTQ